MITKDSSNMRCDVLVFWDAIRRVPLLPHFDKPAFSRIHQTFQPRFVVHNFGEFVKRRVCQNGGGVAHGCSIPEKPTHRIRCCYYLLYHLAKLLQKIIASQKNQHIASHVATIFCNHLAKLLQKIVASQKTNTIQPSATRPHFGQTCLFTNFPNILTTIRGSEFKGIREKAGLSKMGVSCRRLVYGNFIPNLRKETKTTLQKVFRMFL